MTNPNNNPAEGNAQMPAENRGLVLQRGGQEMILEKINDRFTVGQLKTDDTDQLAMRLHAQFNPGKMPTQIAEFLVDPNEQEQAMRSARSSGQVGYASHVYQVKDDPTSRIYLTEQITVQFTPQTTATQITEIIQPLGLRQVKPIEDLLNTFVMELTAATTENPLKITNRLMQEAAVLTAEPNIVVAAQSHYRPRDPLYAKQWHLNHNGGRELTPGSHIYAEAAWDVTRGHRSIVVAVMDDAIDTNHPDFQGPGKIVAPRDFKGRDFQPDPGENWEDHGTACAGVAVAEENGIGVVGVAPECALMPIRTTGYLDDQTIEELFTWATENGAAVISCSWGPSAVNYPLSLRQKAAITRAATRGRRGKGCVILFAAGNANRPTNGTINEAGWERNTLSGPTKWYGGFTVHPDVITVAACTSLNRKSAYSNWGREISVCGPSNNAPPGVGLPSIGYVATPPQLRSSTPGLGIVTTDRIGAPGYDRSNYDDNFGGTSSACPLVAGVAALVLSANPQLTAREVRQILEQTADKILDPNPDPQFGLRKGTYESNGRSDWFGYGKVNAQKAVNAARSRRVNNYRVNRWLSALSNNKIAIPDGATSGISSRINIAEQDQVKNLQVTVDIDHQYLGDLSIELIAPSGEVALLQGRTLGRRTKLQTIYDLQNTPNLQRLLDQSTRGAWQLRLSDAIDGDQGTLNWWKLTIGV
ncbi:S8 family serine peptidase [filamentous cyanobacterium LEGE 11480]|uniref:S8 family serine peptidase n=1 Tax=Romeriopsis navalis LEGE 11480 TaxID=2777977 RepID=A0A928VL16_9CYAN|nr:S8 family serine peptidase [Romeriopsis navalis]MBE9028327.1 S8 family serine peptidase [Romeriopsis navalis LEGE 11480]